MTAYLLLLHLAQLALPAAALAVLMVSVASWMPGWRGRQAVPVGWVARVAWTFALNLAVSVAALVTWQADGKLLAYAALVVVSALAQFVFWRGWKA